MDVPPILRSAIARAKPLARPLFVSSSLFTVLLGIFVWEYTHNPERFGAFEEGEDANADADLSGLTPDEQALLANIDNISVLQRDLGDVPAEGDSDSDEIQQDLSLLQELLGTAPREGSEGAQATTPPLSEYLDRYQFLGAPQRAETAATNIYSGLFGRNSLSATASNTASNFFAGDRSQNDPTATEANRTISPLEAVLRGYDTAPNQNAAQGTTTTGNNGGGNTAETASGQRTANTSGIGPNGLPAPVSIPGVAGPFLPTTPQMSPPPGTTGYTPPASFQITPTIPNATGTSSNGFPNSAFPNNAFPNSSAPLNLTTPNANVGGGSVLPTTPVVPAAPAIPPAPFSVQRPPGSYIGGGYINTFSNPSGPPPEY